MICHMEFFSSVIISIQLKNNKKEKMKCKLGGDPSNCICDVSTIHVPKNVEVSKNLVDQVFNSKVQVKVKRTQMKTKQIQKKDLPAGNKWPLGVKRINFPANVQITPNLLKQLFQGCCKVYVKKSI